MKVRATTNFAGEICMAMGEVRDVPKSVAAPLLKCGYLEQVDTTQTQPQSAPQTDPANTDPANTDNPDAKTEG